MHCVNTFYFIAIMIVSQWASISQLSHRKRQIITLNNDDPAHFMHTFAFRPHFGNQALILTNWAYTDMHGTGANHMIYTSKFGRYPWQKKQ